MNSSSANEQTLTVLNGFYQSAAEKNPEAVASYFAEIIDWYIPTSDLLSWTGKLTNKSEITKALRLLFDAFVEGEDQFEIGHMFIDGNEAAVFGKLSRVVKETGKKFTTPFCQRFTIADEKITHFLMLEDGIEIEKAFRK
jgi:ketosteroid isomerase-like protein